MKLCPLRSAFIHTTTLILGTTHCCSCNYRSQSQRPHHTYTETTALASHPCPYRIQNLPPNVGLSHPFWNLSIIHVIHGPEQGFSNCGSRPTNGSRSPSTWVSGMLCAKTLLR